MIEVFWALPAEANDFRHLIAPALEHGGDLDASVDDVVEAIYHGQQQLLLIIIDDEVVAGMVVEHVKNCHPYLLAFTVAGERLDEWIGHAEDALRLYARQLGVDKIVAVTRPGMGKFLRGRGWQWHAELVSMQVGGKVEFLN